MSDEPIRTVDEPHDRLTRLCDAMLDELQRNPEYHEDDRCVIFLNDEQGGGAVLHGYGDKDLNAMVDIFMQMRAIFRANGKDLQLHALGRG